MFCYVLLNRISQIIAMVMEECRQREKYVKYLRKVDQELYHHSNQMDSTLILFNRCDLEMLCVVLGQ